MSVGERVLTERTCLTRFAVSQNMQMLMFKLELNGPVKPTDYLALTPNDFAKSH